MVWTVILDIFKSLRLDGDGEGDDVEKDPLRPPKDRIAMPSLPHS